MRAANPCSIRCQERLPLKLKTHPYDLLTCVCAGRLVSTTPEDDTCGLRVSSRAFTPAASAHGGTVVGEVVAHLLYEYDYSRGRTEMPNFISTLPSSFNYAAGVKHPSTPGELGRADK
jgi:hypothetical protein